MMTGSETASMRSERRIALQDLGEEIKNLKPQLDEFDLRKLNIRVQKIDLDGKPDFEPSFFQPYQGPLLPPDEAAMEREWLSYEEESESEEFPSNPVDRALGLSIYFRDYLSFCRMIVSEQGQRHGLWSYKECVSSPSVYWFAMILLLTMRDSMRDYRFKGILYADSDISWRLIKVYYIQGREYPHLNCMMLYDASKENRLLRGELQAIITMMIQHLRSKRFTDHIVAPVLLFSFMGPHHARILQARFDGTKLVVHYSNLYNFEHKDIPSLQLFVRWALSVPTGVTQA